jgi:hypothetical protein
VSPLAVGNRALTALRRSAKLLRYGCARSAANML